MKLHEKAIGIFDYIIGFLAVLAAVLLVFITLSVTTGVITRYLFRHPIIWVVEISQYSLLFITFLGAAWVLQRERHVKMDMLLDRLGQRSKALVSIITSGLAAVVCLIVVWYSVLSTWTYFKLDYFTPTILEVPQWIILAIIPVGTFMLFVQFIRRAYGYWKTWKVPPGKK